MKITAVGSIAYDTIQTPFAKAKDILGGSLTYFALAASYFTKIGIVGIVGTDYKPKDLSFYHKHNIDTSGLKIAPGKTFRWSGKYDFDLSNRETLSTHLNVFENFNPILPKQYLNSKYLYIGNIHPRLQLRLSNQMKNSDFIIADTMNYWIEKNRKELVQALKFVDILIINESEVREFAQQANLIKAAYIILNKMGTNRSGLPTLIVKQGEHGCLSFRKKSLFSLPAYPLEEVYDPTGAGDSFAGGFTGYLASKTKLDEKTLKEALVYGTVMASFCVEKLGPYNLTNLSKSKIKNRVSLLREVVRI